MKRLLCWTIVSFTTRKCLFRHRIGNATLFFRLIFRLSAAENSRVAPEWYYTGRLATLHLFKTYIRRSDSRQFYPLCNLIINYAGRAVYPASQIPTQHYSVYRYLRHLQLPSSFSHFNNCGVSGTISDLRIAMFGLSPCSHNVPLNGGEAPSPYVSFTLCL